MARFLMNLMLAAGGYPWTVIRFGDREEYLSALDSASIDSDIAPFTRLTARRAVWQETEFGKKIWWRRRESNPRPRKLEMKSLRAYPIQNFRQPRKNRQD